MPRQGKQPFEETFATRLRELMEENSTTQTQLAEALDVRRQTVSLYMNGQSNPDWKVVAAIARYFGVTADYLVGLEDTRSHEYAGVQKETGLDEYAIGEIKRILSTDWKGAYGNFSDFAHAFIDIGGSAKVRFPTSYPINDIMNYLIFCGTTSEMLRSSVQIMDAFFLEAAADKLRHEWENGDYRDAHRLREIEDRLREKAGYFQWRSEADLVKSLRATSEIYISKKIEAGELEWMDSESAQDYLAERASVVDWLTLFSRNLNLVMQLRSSIQDRSSFENLNKTWMYNVLSGESTEDDYRHWLNSYTEGGVPDGQHNPQDS